MAPCPLLHRAAIMIAYNMNMIIQYCNTMIDHYNYLVKFFANAAVASHTT